MENKWSACSFNTTISGQAQTNVQLAPICFSTLRHCRCAFSAASWAGYVSVRVRKKIRSFVIYKKPTTNEEHSTRKYTLDGEKIDSSSCRSHTVAPDLSCSSPVQPGSCNSKRKHAAWPFAAAKCMHVAPSLSRINEMLWRGKRLKQRKWKIKAEIEWERERRLKLISCREVNYEINRWGKEIEE